MAVADFAKWECPVNPKSPLFKLNQGLIVEGTIPVNPGNFELFRLWRPQLRVFRFGGW